MTRLITTIGISGIISVALINAALAHDNRHHHHYHHGYHHDHHGYNHNSRGQLFDNPAYENFNDHEGPGISGYFGEGSYSAFDFDPEIDLPEPGLRPAQAQQ